MQAIARLDSFALTSEWVNASGAITYGPTLATASKQFVISGIPAGSTINWARFSGTFGSPYSGADELKAAGQTVGYGTQTVSLTPLSGGNGTYTVEFRFKAFGIASLSDGSHSGTVVVDSPTVTVDYTLDEEEEEEEEEEERLAANTAEQIAVFPPTATNFLNNGAAILFPISAEVREQAGGEFSLTLTHPMDEVGKWQLLQEEWLIRSPVPEKRTPRIVMPAAALWQVSAATTPMYSVLPTWTKAETPVDQIIGSPGLWEWQSANDYYMGDYVTYQDCIWVAIEDNAGDTPGVSPAVWELVLDYGSGQTPSPSYIYDPGTVAETLTQGEIITFVADYNGTYMRVRSLRGVTGYVRRSDCAATDNTSQTVIPAREIMAQVFRIQQVTVNNDTRTVTVYAPHISYDFGANRLYDCQLTEASPATAIAILQGATVTPDSRLIATNITSPAITADWSWGSPLQSILDPDSGLVGTLRAQLIRDDEDFFLLSNDTPETGPALRYGDNLLGVSWKKDVSSLITRVIPRGTKEDGSTLLLPEVYIDSDDINAYPLIYLEILDCGCQVGATEKMPDGTERTLTLDDCYQIMRQKAQSRFDVDHCDAVAVQLTVNPLLLGDTEEYAQYRGLVKLHLYDAIPVVIPHAGLNATAQMSAYTWDAAPGKHRYTSITLGEVFSFGGRSVAGYNVATGAISYEKLSPGLVKKIRSMNQNNGGA